MTEEQKEKKPIEQVLGTILQMTQYMQHATKTEAAKILCDSGWCSEYIDKCPHCEVKKTDEGDEEE